MNILGPDELVFGVDDIAGCAQYLRDYGLHAIECDDKGGRFEALDGTAVSIRRDDDDSLPPKLPTHSRLRETIYGVADSQTLDDIATELSKDRSVTRLTAPGGALQLRSVDDMGFAVGFRVTLRKPYDAAPALCNAPGTAPQRAVNQIAVDPHAIALPRTLSHVVYFVPDVAKAQAFYIERLGFRITDSFEKVGPFLRPAGSQDHHALFLIQTPAFMQGIDHFAFHLGSVNELMQAGTRFVEKGYQSFWGPGRHLFGSNWFWYFNSPLGCKMEYDADMDQHDDNWVPRTAPINADNSQLFLFESRKKWAPGGDPH